MRSAVFVLASCLSYASALLDQAYGVEGRILCGTEPAAKVQVKLYDKDFGPDPDDLLGEAYTDSDGHFSIKGSTQEVTPIDPELYIYHDCDDILPGLRKVKLVMPKKYINRDSTIPKSIMNIGQINLEIIFPDEGRSIWQKVKRAQLT